MTVKVKRSQAKTEKAIFLSDWHVPHHDPVAVELALAFCEWFKPDTVFVLGDYIDTYALSRYDKDPQKILSLQEELDTGRALLGRLRKACPRSRIEFLSGNHEFRLTRWLWNHPEVSALDNMKLPELLHLGDLKIHYHEYTEQLQWHGLLVEHGDIVRQGSAMTAKGMLDRRGVSGISGHTHRLGACYLTNHSGVKVWHENGCLCLPRVYHGIGKANWQQGFSIGFAPKDGSRFLMEQIPLLPGGKLFYAGQVWKA